MSCLPNKSSLDRAALPAVLLLVLALPATLYATNPYAGSNDRNMGPTPIRGSGAESSQQFDDTIDFYALNASGNSAKSPTYDDTLDFLSLHEQHATGAPAQQNAGEHARSLSGPPAAANSRRQVMSGRTAGQQAARPAIRQTSPASQYGTTHQRTPVLPATRTPDRPAAPHTSNMLERPKIIFNPVAVGVDKNGNSTLRPIVQLADGRMMSENLPSLKLAQHEAHSLPTPPQTQAPRQNQVPRARYAQPQSRLVPHSQSQPQSQPMSRLQPGEPTYAGPPTEFEGEYGSYMVADDGMMSSIEGDAATYPIEESWGAPGCGDACPTCEQEDCGYGCGPHRNRWFGCLGDLHDDCCDVPGIGREHVMNALFFLDTTQPLNNCRIRLDAGDDWEFPDRAEYFWARTPFGRGPIDPSGQNRGEPAVDYQDMRFYIERGGKRFSIGTELPIRSVDPELRLNSTGFADMNLTTKALLLDGRCWQLTQVFRTYFPTGSAHRGTGNGHFSFEPGIAARYKISDETYLHGDLTYWFPVAGDPEWQGQILNAGIGISHVLYDNDSFAIIPTFEIDSSTVLDGRETIPFIPQGMSPPDPAQLALYSYDIDTISILNLHPGVRFICDKGCDCGTKEFGIAGGVAVSEDQFYSAMLRLEFRWTH